jgi:L-seryl-tRNA(Ser) seleniumtransferase
MSASEQRARALRAARGPSPARGGRVGAELKELKSIPSVESLVSDPGLSGLLTTYSRSVVVDAIREVLDGERKAILGGAAPTGRDGLMRKIDERLKSSELAAIRRVVNATGVILHTNLGRAPMSREAADAMREVAAGYCNLEYDLEEGVRTRRGLYAERLLARLSGAEDALVVNNNAAAVLLLLNTLAEGREVLVSRGELIEIGGSFRLPDIMRKSGARLVEVGTTNKTSLKDYDSAITDRTALILKAHWSNFRIVGFSAEASLAELVGLGADRGIPVAFDVGSGAMVDLGKYGFSGEPVVPASVAAGAAAVTFSGDKLLGGPQAGLVVGRADAISRMRGSPMARAVRVDKCVLAALERTLKVYLTEDGFATLPGMSALLASAEDLAGRIKRLKRKLSSLESRGLEVQEVKSHSEAGGGSLPAESIPTRVIRIRVLGRSADALSRSLRLARTPVIARVHEDWVVLDPRTILDRDEEEWVFSAVLGALGAEEAQPGRERGSH